MQLFETYFRGHLDGFFSLVGDTVAAPVGIESDSGKTALNRRKRFLLPDSVQILPDLVIFVARFFANSTRFGNRIFTSVKPSRSAPSMALIVPLLFLFSLVLIPSLLT